MEQFPVPWTSVHSVSLCKRTEVNTFLFPSLIHFSSCEYPINFRYQKSPGFLQISKMASDQNVALMLMQVLIQHISDEFMAWFHVFFLDDVIEIGQLVGYFEKQAIPRINGYFDITVSTHFDSQFRSHFRMSRETLTVEVLTKIIGNCRYHLHKKNRLGMLLYLKKLLKKQIKIILVHKVF